MSCKQTCNTKSIASRLKHRATIFREPSPGDVDEAGQPIEDYVQVATAWAGIEPLRGREFFAAQQVNSEVTTRIIIRYRDNVDRTMIVRHKNKEFEILYTINPEMANIELQLMCKERQ